MVFSPTALKTFSPNITQIMKQAMVILISPLQILFRKAVFIELKVGSLGSDLVSLSEKHYHK